MSQKTKTMQSYWRRVKTISDIFNIVVIVVIIIHHMVTMIVKRGSTYSERMMPMIMVMM